MSPTSVVIGLLVFGANAAFWLYLAMRAWHHQYPVTFIGWASLVGDPIFAALLAAFAISAFWTKRKYGQNQ